MRPVADAGTLPSVVHVSGDFPDPVDPHKTTVIRALLELTEGQFSHRVISLNRRAGGRAGSPAVPFDWGEAWVYRAPPWGIFHRTLLRQLGARIAQSLADAPPDLLVGHKLTIEGLAVAEAAQRLQRPYAITIQGNSDGKILAARPDLRRAFARVFHGAAVVLAFAPWALAEVERRLGRRSGPNVLVPCPTDLDEPLMPAAGGGGGLLSAFHLRHASNKNLPGMVAALHILRERGENAPFWLAGGGDDVATTRCAAQLAGVSDATLLGALDRDSLRKAMHSAVGFVMPSHRESFGLVFIEALFAGIPIIYPENRAVAGWFDDAPFAIAVNPRDPVEIANAMSILVQQEAALKRSLAAWHGTAHARQFARTHIAEHFCTALNHAINHNRDGCQRQAEGAKGAGNSMTLAPLGEKVQYHSDR